MIKQCGFIGTWNENVFSQHCWVYFQIKTKRIKPLKSLGERKCSETDCVPQDMLRTFRFHWATALLLVRILTFVVIIDSHKLVKSSQGRYIYTVYVKLVNGVARFRLTFLHFLLLTWCTETYVFCLNEFSLSGFPSGRISSILFLFFFWGGGLVFFLFTICKFLKFL